MIPAGLPPATSVINAPPRGPTVEYGEYLFSYQDCRNCHGEDLNGGVQGQLMPIGPPLKHIRSWTLEQYITAMRTGMTPYGHQMQDPMPWHTIGQLDDDELASMYAYLASLE